MPPIARPVAVRTYARNFWHILSGRELRRDVRGYLQRNLPSLQAVHAAFALPGAAHVLPANILMMSATDAKSTATKAASGARRPSSPPAPPKTPVPASSPSGSNGHTPEGPQRSSRLFRAVYFSLAGLASVAAAVIPATNVLSWVAPLTLVKYGALAALGLSAGINLTAGLALAYGAYRLVWAVKNRPATPPPLSTVGRRTMTNLPQAQVDGIVSQIIEIQTKPRVEATSVSLVQGYQDLIDLKTHLANSDLRLPQEIRDMAELKIEELAEDIKGASEPLGLVMETSDKRHFFIMPTKQQKDGIDAITTLDPYALCLGVGGVGEVFLGATSESLSKVDAPIEKVAVKVIKEDSDSALQADLRARLEAKVQRLGSHKNIIKVLGSGKTPQERPFLVLEFIDGKTLKDVVQEDHGEGRQARATKVAEWTKQTLTAMVASHAENIFHRDLKLENVFVTKIQDPRTKEESDLIIVADFGLAKITDENIEASLKDATTTGQVPGTLSYLPPESTIIQTISRQLNEVEKARWMAKWDIYALGNIMYRLFTQKMPHQIRLGPDFLQFSLGFVHANDQRKLGLPEGDPSRITVAQVLTDMIKVKDKQYLELDLEGVPTAYRHIIAKALAYNPLERYDSVKEMLADLEEVIKDPSAFSKTASVALPETPTVAANGKARTGPPPLPPKPPTEPTIDVPAEELDFSDLEAPGAPAAAKAAAPEPAKAAPAATAFDGIIRRLNSDREQFVRDFIEDNVDVAEVLEVYDLATIESVKLERELNDIGLSALETSNQTLYDNVQLAIAMIRATREEKANEQEEA